MSFGFPTINVKDKDIKDRLFLVNADLIVYDQYVSPGAQHLSGHVHFRHGGMNMWADSAIYYQESSTFQAFGKVKVTQGDTLSLTGKYLSYDGTTEMAEVRYDVVLKHRGETLLTDSLNYDRVNNYGYYFNGGKLIDHKNVLTSDWGEYYLGNKNAKFYYNVQLNTPEYRITTDTLYYDLQSKGAEMYGPSNIFHGNDYVYTTKAFYNGQKDEYRISKTTQKATVYHNASFKRGKLTSYDSKLSGDSIYSKKNGWTEVWGNALYEDKKEGVMMLSDFGTYNQLTKNGLATGKTLVKYFQNSSDTLFFHADTLKLYTFDRKTNKGVTEQTDSVYRMMHAYYHARAYRRDVQAVADSLVYNTKNNTLTLYKDPVLWSDNRQVLGEEIRAYLNDSNIDSVHVDRQALIVENVDSDYYNQITGEQIRSYFHDGQLVRNEADKNVRLAYYPQEKNQAPNSMWYMETSLMKMFLKDKKLMKLWTPASQGTGYPLNQIPSDKKFLPNFAWFDYMRPLNKNDVFVWKSKKSGTELKIKPRREAPIQHLK